MKLGFYYHIPCYIDEKNNIFLPAFLGLFIDSLALKCDELLLFLHKSDKILEYKIISKNVKFVSLGVDRPAYIKTFLTFPFFKSNVISEFNKIDILIVRGPSPLLHHFSKYIESSKIVYFIVGSYEEGILHMKKNSVRNQIIIKVLKYIHKKQLKVIKKNKLIVNSEKLLDYYKNISNEIFLVNTTTITKNDFYIRENTCLNKNIQLYFIARFDWTKGINELLEAFLILNKNHINVFLNFVGWEDYLNKPVENSIKEWAYKNNLSDKVVFHGRKTAGIELLEYYRKADIYILPSYHEGFPRTIWEAMASSVPVIATEVGSIPHFLIHEENAFLIPPKNSEAIYESIKRLINDSNLRRKIIKGGLDRVKNVTLENQSDLIIKFIKK
jgi:glycosyltransferase involved in cell wall biosynthesis